jgi:hypothetical protein
MGLKLSKDQFHAGLESPTKPSISKRVPLSLKASKKENGRHGKQKEKRETLIEAFYHPDDAR